MVERRSALFYLLMGKKVQVQFQFGPANNVQLDKFLYIKGSVQARGCMITIS